MRVVTPWYLTLTVACTPGIGQQMTRDYRTNTIKNVLHKKKTSFDSLKKAKQKKKTTFWM